MALKRIHLQRRSPRLDSWVRKMPWRMDRLPTPVSLGFPCGSAGKESACNAGDLGSIPGLGRCPRGAKGYPLLYSGLENPMDCTVHGVTKSRTRLNDFHFLLFFFSIGWVYRSQTEPYDPSPAARRCGKSDVPAWNLHLWESGVKAGGGSRIKSPGMRAPELKW